MSLSARIQSVVSFLKAWLFQDRHKKTAHEMKERTEHAFINHPHEAGETYLQHLWFTMRMSGRFAFLSIALAIHGVFPFLFVKTASTEMERIHQLMKARSSATSSSQEHKNDSIDTIGEMYDGQ